MVEVHGTGDPRILSVDPFHFKFNANDVSFMKSEIAGYRIGAECEDWQTVREHEGLGEPLIITNVVNLGERNMPGPNQESQFLNSYPGLMGSLANDRPHTF